MAKNSVRDFDATAANNTDIQSVDIAENCAPSGINNAIRELMADIKDVSTGTVALESPQADSMTVTGDLTVDTNTLYVDSTNDSVGIGTTSPSAPFSNRALEVSGTGGNGGVKVIRSDAATAGGLSLLSGSTTHSLYGEGAKDLNFWTNATERMRIDSTGDVGIGTTSPGHPLHVSGNGFGTIAKFSADDGANNPRLLIYGSSDGMHIQRTSGSGAANLMFEVGGAEGGGTEAMRINSSGKVGIGTSTISGKLTVAGDDAFEAITLRDNTSSANMFSITCAEYSGSGGNPNKFSAINSSAISFELGGLERMRLSHTSNALSIGKTTFGTSGQGFTVYGNTAPQCYFNKSQSGAVNGVLFYHANSYVGGLNYNNTNTSLATSSDERLKDNIENSDDAGAKIDAMQVRQFDWKSTGEHQEYGFVAQELEPVFAHAVHTDKEGDYKSVDYACLVPMLVKEIQSLRQRITDLENA
jgi:hypothetical protein